MSPFRKGKRNKLRTKMVVPVRVRLAGTNPAQVGQPAHTLDATQRGVKLAGLQGELKVGDVIEIQHHHARALFRVVWIHAVGKSSEKHVGAECIEAKNIWETQFSEQTDEYEEQE